MADATAPCSSNIRSSDDLWTHLAPSFSHARLFNSQKLLQSNGFGVRERHSPSLGIAYRQRWAKEDAQQDEWTAGHRPPKGYLKPARGTELHDEVEYEHFYVDAGPTASAAASASAASPAAAVRSSQHLTPAIIILATHPTVTATIRAPPHAATPAAISTSLPSAPVARPMRSDDHKERTRPARYAPSMLGLASQFDNSDDEHDTSTYEAALRTHQRNATAASSAAAASTGAVAVPAVAVAPVAARVAPPPSMLRLRSQPPMGNRKRIAQQPIRLTMHAHLVHRSTPAEQSREREKDSRAEQKVRSEVR